MDEGHGRTERFVRWSVENPIGWLLFQFAQVLAAAVVVRLIGWALGDRASSSLLWGLFAVIVFGLAALNYLLRRRILSDVDGSDPRGDSRSRG
jgi:F0F1-type ATP synthase assembly protein I